MEYLIKRFVDEIASGRVHIYNEFSLQHELGIYLRSKLEGKKVQFERNISFFGLNKSEFVKREIDISVFSDENMPETAVELKYPRNGQHPEQMFSFCKDVQFAEQLKSSRFKEAYVVIFADDPLFYERGSQEGIYSFFRGERNLSGEITKPTGKKDDKVNIKGSYTVKWHTVTGDLKYTMIEVDQFEKITP